MEGDHERGAGVERADAGEQSSGGRRVEALGGLVEEQHVRAPEQALRDAEPTALAG